MKRLWIACGILLLVFLATLYHTYYLNGITTELSSLLSEAERQAESGNWEQANRLTDQAFQRWEEHGSYLHVLLRHNDIDQIQTGFQEVQNYIDCQESGEYSAANSRLLVQIKLLYETEQLSLQNIL